MLATIIRRGRAMPVKPIPDGYHSVTPMLIVNGAARVIDFMKAAFGAEERMLMPMPDGRVAHAELMVGDSCVMLSDGSPEWPPIGGAIHLYVEDVDATYRRALAAGATSRSEPQDQFYGDRSASVVDPAGIVWSIATHVEDVSDEEIMKRMQAMPA
jgi:PhnB protein